MRFQAGTHELYQVLLGAGLRVGENIVYYVLTVFSLTFLVDVAAQSRSLALDALLIGAAVQFTAIPLLAALSDRPGCAGH